MRNDTKQLMDNSLASDISELIRKCDENTSKGYKRDMLELMPLIIFIETLIYVSFAASIKSINIYDVVKSGHVIMIVMTCALTVVVVANALRGIHNCKKIINIYNNEKYTAMISTKKFQYYGKRYGEIPSGRPINYLRFQYDKNGDYKYANLIYGS